jgi:hypothetical protein
MGLVKRGAPADIDAGVGAPQPSATLADPDPARRRAAVVDLRDSPDGLDAIAAHLPGESDPAVLEIAFAALAGAGRAAAIAPMLDAEEAALRNGAVEALTALADGARASVEPRLTDPDPDVRIGALAALRDMDPAWTAARVATLLQDDTDVRVCITAVELLAELGPDAAPAEAALRALPARFPDDEFVGFAAEMALDAARGRT